MIKSLARTDDARANHMWRVESRGHKFPLPFTQTSEGLTVELPHEEPGDLTCSLIVTGRNLLPFIPPATVRVVRADPTGTLTLSATDAGLKGSHLQLEQRGGLPNIGFWHDGNESVFWTAQIDRPGVFQVSATVATPYPDPSLAVEAGGESVIVHAPQTDSGRNSRLWP